MNLYIKTATLVPTLIFVISACNPNGVHFKVGNKVIDESVLKSEYEQEYKGLKSNYEMQVSQMLKGLAYEKLIELAAKEKGQDKNAYMKSVLAAIPAPTEAQIASKYTQLQELGLISPTTSLAKSRGAVLGQLQKDMRDIAIAREFGLLRVKYGFKSSVEEEFNIGLVATDRRRGKKDAKITIIEYTDFQCPFCARAQGTSRQLRTMYGDKIQWVFRDYILVFHKQAMYAHQIGQCIHKQDELVFWNYFDRLFASLQVDRANIEPAKIDRLVAGLGVNMGQLKSCQTSPATQEQVLAEQKSGDSYSVRGTPAFFINGRFISGAAPLREFVGVIEEELAN